MRKQLFYLTILFTTWVYGQTMPEIEWQKCLGSQAGDYASSIAQTPDGGYITMGLILDASGDVSGHYGEGDYWVAKLSASGEVEWDKNYGGDMLEGGSPLIHKIQVVPSGGYILAGTTTSNNGDVSLSYGEYYDDYWYSQGDIWLVKIDDIGNIEWEKTYGGMGLEYFQDLQITPDGGYIFTAQTTSTDGDVDSEFIEYGSYSVAWVVKLDSEGTIEWQNDFGGYDSFNTYFRSIQLTSDGGYIATGISDGWGGDVPETNGIRDFWVVKISNEGETQWSKSYGGSSHDEPSSIKQTYEGGYIVVGQTYSNDGDVSGSTNPNQTALWVIKLDNQGELEWQKIYGGSATENGNDVQVIGNLGYLIGGSTNSTDGDFPVNQASDLFLLRIDLSGEMMWTKTIGGSQVEIFHELKLTNDGGFVAIGDTNSNDGDISGNNGSTDFWVVKLSPECTVPELTIDTTHTICVGQELTLNANFEAELINWYDAADAETPIFTGTEFELPALTETTSFWIEASNYTCKSERLEIVITVNPLPILEAETTYAICSENPASLYASSPNNVIFWYANEDDTEYLYHGNLFVTEVLTENTTFWVEAYNLSTGCTSERIEVTVTVGEALPAPIADDTQEFVAGMTLADLVVEHTAPLTWYADAQLTQELPETTLVVVGTTYYVTQSGVGCESASTAILVDTFLGNGNLNSDKFAYYPNPVKDILNFKGNEIVKSIQIYDLNGKLILNQNSNSISSINLNSLPKGTYVVKATTEKQVNTFKIVKN